MEIIGGILLGIGWLLFFVSLRLVTTTIHELGHAIPALVFSKEPVQIFIGTYGNEAESQPFVLGRLQVFFSMNLFQWNLGLCRHATIKKIWDNIIIVAGGPLASLSIAIFALLIINNYELSNVGLLVAVTFAVAATFDFFANILPNNATVEMYDGSGTYNDGQQLVFLFQHANLPEKYFDLEEKYMQEKYEEVINDFTPMLEKGESRRVFLDLLINSYIAQKKYTEALSLFSIIKQHHKLGYDDYSSIGNLYFKMNNYPEAIKYFNHYLFKNFSNALTLNLRGSCHLMRSDYEAAISDFQTAILYAPGFAEAYNNLGLAKIRLGASEEGYQDIKHAQSLDEKNPQIPYHLGIYYEEKRDYKNAFEYYQKAKDMNIDYHGIDYKINEMEEWIGRHENL